MGRDRSRDRHSRREERRQRMEAAVRMTQPLQGLPVYALASEEAIERIHQAAMRILAEVGIAFLEAESLDLLRQYGATVVDELVLFEPGLIEQAIATAPSQFTQLARNPENNVVLGGDHLCFAPVYGPPFVYDRVRGRREAMLADFVNFVKLAQSSPYLHHAGGTIVEPTDQPVATRHLDMLFSLVKYSDKAFMGSVMSAENAADSVALAEILFGAEAMQENPALLALINISSPRRLDDRMLGALKVYARARQATIITPFILSGAMAPVSVAATLAQQHAEALAGIAFTQIVQPGAPVVYGSFQTNIDLRSGAPVFGSPESQLALWVSAQLARRQKLPFRSGGMFASSKISDAQAAYESVMTMLPAVLAGTNFILHAAGWLEGGLVAGYEKFVLDCELLGMFHKLLEGLDVSDEALALDSIRSVPPGGHHLGTEHTMRHFLTAFYRAELFDYNSYEQWSQNGSADASQRASEKVRQLLRSYEPPPLEDSMEEALADLIARRKEEITNGRT